MKKYKDEMMRTLFKLGGLSNKIAKESFRQLEKWGIQKHTLPEWLMFTTEELGELANAISEFMYREGKPEEIFFEAIQVATLALKIAEMIKLQEIEE